MTIKKFVGKTKEEAIALAKTEMGASVVIMNVKEIRQKGLFSIFKGSQYEVTAAIEDDVVAPKPFSMEKPQMVSTNNRSNFDAVADEKLPLPGTSEETAWKDAFAAIHQVIATEDEKQEKAVKQDPVVHKKMEEKKETVFQPLEEMPFVEEIPGKEQENQAFFKMLYRMLLDNEVDEVFINQFMDDIDKVSHSTNGLDYLISNVYQKMILKLGQPDVITLSKRKPKVVFFIGPTGVGKTTTIAKIASRFKLEHEKNVALLTADTYRIAAAEQLRTYANILDTPLSIIYSPEDIGKEIETLSAYDLIFVDTAGFSHKNQEQRADMKLLLESVPGEYDTQIYLVLSATTKYKDLLEITKMYQELCSFSLIFTKLDETSHYGNLLNLKMKTDAPLSYVTTGQNVPDDIEVVDTQKLVKQLLGGK